MIIVLSGSITSDRNAVAGLLARALADDDAAVRTNALRSLASFQLPQYAKQVVRLLNDPLHNVAIKAVTIRDYTMQSGQPFTAQDVDAAAKVALLGSTVATNLFGRVDPVGQVIRIKNVPFTVSGVLTSKGQSPTGQDQDDTILIPLSSPSERCWVTISQPEFVASIMVRLRPQLMKKPNARSPTARQRHRIQPPKTTISLSAISKKFAQSSSRVCRPCSLLSPSPGRGGSARNIMLVSVTERTREIEFAWPLAKWRHPQPPCVEATLSLAGGNRYQLGWRIRARFLHSEVVDLVSPWPSCSPSDFPPWWGCSSAGNRE
jgi:putative ABC transport system permease protein